MDYLAHPIVPPSGPTHSYKQVKRAAFSQCWRIFKMACGKAPQERTYGICRTASSGIRTARAATSATTSPAPWWIRAATTEAKTARRGGTKVGRGSRSISMTLSAGSLPVPRGAEGASSTCSRTPGGESTRTWWRAICAYTTKERRKTSSSTVCLEATKKPTSKFSREGKCGHGTCPCSQP